MERLKTPEEETLASLEAKRNELVDRLDKGADKIEEARKQGKNVEDWESYWISLLRQYEKLCDRIAELQV